MSRTNKKILSNKKNYQKSIDSFFICLSYSVWLLIVSQLTSAKISSLHVQLFMQ